MPSKTDKNGTVLTLEYTDNGEPGEQVPGSHYASLCVMTGVANEDYNSKALGSYLSAIPQSAESDKAKVANGAIAALIAMDL